MLWSFAYLAVRNLFALVWLLARSRRSKELEILVLRQELAILRRQTRVGCVNSVRAQENRKTLFAGETEFTTPQLVSAASSAIWISRPKRTS